MLVGVLRNVARGNGQEKNRPVERDGQGNDQWL